jgi:hypothetical protein
MLTAGGMISKRYGVERRLEQDFSLFYWILVPAAVSEVRRNFCHPGTTLLVPILFRSCPPAAKNAYKFLRSSLSWYTFPEKSKNCDELINYTVLVSISFVIFFLQWIGLLLCGWPCPDTRHKTQLLDEV